MRFEKNKKRSESALEESLGEEWSRAFGAVEVSIGNGPFFLAALALAFVGLIFFFRVAYLNVYRGDLYGARAEANLLRSVVVPAPRGLIYDRNGEILAENEVVFSALLDVKEFLEEAGRGNEGRTIKAIETTLYVPESEIWSRILEGGESEFLHPIVLADNLTRSQLVRLEGFDLPAVAIKKNFRRVYRGGGVFSSVTGYVGRVSPEDLEADPGLSGEEFAGKAGIELFYDGGLRGRSGLVEEARDARGGVLSEEIKREPEIGKEMRLAVDKEFQEFFYWRLKSGLAELGRRVGVGLAINPKNGEVLSLINLPGYDGNLFLVSGRNEEKKAVLGSPDKPLFNRAVGGLYNPGSTIKPLHAAAALAEGVIGSDRKIFSPGFLDIPNPYAPDEFSRYHDWRYQGSVDVRSAIAQSSNVYFYLAGGGSPANVSPPEILRGEGRIQGLGISRLQKWWKTFFLGRKTGIDLPGEADGFLPSPEWKEKKSGAPWLLGDTYNVSIGQGDLLLTPLQIINYISAMANGGKIYKPVVNLELEHPELLADLAEFSQEIAEVRKGMRLAVTSPMGTAHLLDDLVFPVAAKTGTAQVQGNSKLNALFAGYAPADDPQIAILILIEDVREGILNTVPIAKDVLDWYYWNRIKK